MKSGCGSCAATIFLQPTLIAHFSVRLAGHQRQHPPRARQSNGTLLFDFSLKVKEGKDPERPVFTGPYASGAVDDRFVYLSWFAVDRGEYINRVKVRLGAIDWRLIRRSQKENRPITADLSGRGPGETSKAIAWYLP
jgi:Family of unknown function (DUF5990)